MAERDAFGREKNEDSLAELGWRTPAPARVAEPSATTAEPQPREPEPAAPVFEAPPQPPRTYRRPRRRRGFVRLIVFGAIVVVAATSAGSAIEWGRDKVDELESAVRDAVPTQVAPPVGLEGESLFRTAALRKALAQLPDGRIESLRVAPERIDATVAAPGGLRLVQVTSTGRVTTVETPSGGTGATVRVNPAAPARIVRTAARRAGRDPSSVSYLVLMRLGDRAEWQLFFADGLHFSASASGKRVRRIS